MAKDNDGDLITHLNPIRVRIKGEGNLRTSVFNLGEASTDSALLADSVLSATTSKSNNILSNFKSEKIAIDFRTTELEEWFEISNIWAYVKLVAASYPQP